MVRKGLLILSVFLGVFVFMQGVSSQEYTYIVSNSEDWKDVYSTIHYANLQSLPNDFLVSTKHGPLLLYGISKNNFVRVVSSRRSPFIINYDDLIKGNSFEGADEIIVDSANIELIHDLPDIKNFIIVGDDYGYDAISVAPYAMINRAWVFMANRVNIDEIDSVLSNRDVDEVLIYGYLNRDIRETLDKYDPQIIDTGDRFKDNIEILEKYLEIKPVEQILLTNGEFIEKEIMSGMEPIMFTGKQNVPDQIKDYLKNSEDISVAVLVGADLVGAATNIRRSTGISVIVKFARGARAPTGAISGVEGLDLFYLPIPIMDLRIHSAQYNKATSQLELTYKSESNIPIFFKGTITPITESGESTKIGDVDPIFIAPNDFKTVAYSDVNVNGDQLTIDIFTLFGDGPNSLEKILERRMEVEMVNILDSCKIEVEEIKYNKRKEQFIIKVSNLGDVDCWVDIELKDMIIDGIERTLGSEGAIKIEKGKSKKVIIEQEMTDEDLKDNKLVDIIAYYGEREDGLVNVFQVKLELGIEMISFATVSLILIILIVLASIIILVIIIRRRKEEEYW